VAERRLRANLLVALAGAVLVLIDVGGLGVELAGFGLIAVATLLTARARSATGEVNWRRLLLVGAALVAVGIPIGLALETVGGLLAAGGAVLVVVAAVLGLP
jgi:hypothetical protein